MKRPPVWSRRPAPLGSAAFSEPRFKPSLDLVLKVPHSARPVLAQPYPLRELACLLEAVNVSVAVKYELPDLFLREQTQFSRHRGHSM